MMKLLHKLLSALDRWLGGERYESTEGLYRGGSARFVERQRG